MERRHLHTVTAPGPLMYIVAGVALSILAAALTQQRRVANSAYIDSLTGLANRRCFQQRIDDALRSARRRGQGVALLLLDLDRFKIVNDTLGHPIGDGLLVEVARRLALHIRDGDLLARLGGDEFAVLVIGAHSQHDLSELGHRLVAALRDPAHIEGHTLQSGGSIGIAMCPDHGTTERELLQHADTAMYQAKRGRRGVAIYSPQKDGNTERRLVLSTDIATAADRHQIAVLYQPKRSLHTGMVTGVEALVRWNHPSLGMITPAEFVGIAEETGAIGKITQRVIAQVLEHWAPQRRVGAELPVSINLSTRDLLDGSVSFGVSESLRRWGVDGSWLTFEITETAAITDELAAAAAVTALRTLGCRVAIDDFGTGYFSLTGLRRLAIDELKIDQSFVAPMLISQRDAFIVRAVINLAHDLGLSVVAEGVESEAVQAELARLGCDEVQGFHVGRPMSVTELRNWLDHRLIAGAARGIQPPT